MLGAVGLVHGAGYQAVPGDEVRLSGGAQGAKVGDGVARRLCHGERGE